MVSIQELNFLETLGFSRLEIDIYHYLLNNPSATGYAISKETGRYKANVYNALASLKNKGAIYQNEGDGKFYMAVLPHNIVNQMRFKLEELNRHVKNLTKKLSTLKNDERIYQLTTVSQVFEKYRTILKNCSEVALLELFPEPLLKLKKDVEEASSRGIKITLRKYNGNSIKGPKIIQSPFGTDTFKEHSGSWLSVFADGTEFLIAHLAPDHKKVRFAFWSQNPYLSWTFYSYISRDFLYYSLRPFIESSENIKELKTILYDLESQFPIGDEPGSIKLSDFYNDNLI